MIVQTLTSGPLKTNSYAIIDSEHRLMIIVDLAPQSAQRLIQIAEHHGAEIREIWFTHSHWDHIAGLADLIALIGQRKMPLPKIAIHSFDAPNLRNPGCDQIPAPWIKGVDPDLLLRDGDRLIAGRFDFQVLHTPGHSKGSISLYCHSQNALFSGDTLFHQKMGTLSLPTAAPHLMAASLIKLAMLDPQTRIYPGHGPQTTVEGERDWIVERFGKSEIESFQ